MQAVQYNREDRTWNCSKKCKLHKYGIASECWVGEDEYYGDPNATDYIYYHCNMSDCHKQQLGKNGWVCKGCDLFYCFGCWAADVPTATMGICHQCKSDVCKRVEQQENKE